MVTCRGLALITTLACICFTQHQVTGFQLTAEITKTELVPGDSVQIMCKVTGASYNDFVHFVKRLPVGNDLNIASRRTIQPPFSDTYRYAVSSSQGGVVNQIKTYQLVISNVQVEDSGVLGCKVPTRNARTMVEELRVYGPVTDVFMELEQLNKPKKTLYDNDELDMNILSHNRGQKLTCIVHATDPLPDVQMFIGDREITDQFNKEEQVIPESTTSGLKRRRTIVKLENTIFLPDAVDSGKDVRCVANVKLHPAKEVVVKLNIKFPPQITCNKTLAAPGDENVEITCKGRANPRINTVTWFKVKNGRRSALRNDTHHRSRIEFHDDNVFTVKLVIHELGDEDNRSSHYGKYEVEVRNTEGVSPRQPAQLLEGPPIARVVERPITSQPEPETNTDMPGGSVGRVSLSALCLLTVVAMVFA